MAFNIKTIKSYYHLSKPGIVYGNLITSTAGYLFVSHWHKLLGLFWMDIGLALVIGGSCAINNVIDKDIDTKMERTKKRASVTGEIPSTYIRNYGLALIALGAVILSIFNNLTTMYVALFGVLIYVVIYGIAKRRTPYSTMIGAAAGAIPPVVGYTAYSSNIDQGAMILFFILVCWQMAHFYGIALYRKKEYKEAKLMIWPIVKGDWSTQLQAMVFIAIFTIFAMSVFIFGYTGFIYLVVMMVVGLTWLWYSVNIINKYNPTEWGRKIFISSLIVILITSVALSLGPVLP